MVFEDRIQKNPRLLRLKNPATGEVVDWEIQDLADSEVVQAGTEVNAEALNSLNNVSVNITPQLQEQLYIKNNLKSAEILVKNGNTYEKIYEKIGKELEVADGQWNSELRYIALRHLEIGGIYQIAVSYNHRADWSFAYRSTFMGFLSVNVGLDNSWTVAMVRPKLNLILNNKDMDTTPDSNIQVVCEGGGTEVNYGYFERLPQIYINFSNAEGFGDLKVDVKRIL